MFWNYNLSKNTFIHQWIYILEGVLFKKYLKVGVNLVKQGEKKGIQVLTQPAHCNNMNVIDKLTYKLEGY